MRLRFAVVVIAVNAVIATAVGADAVTESVFCSLNHAPAEPCQMSDIVGGDETHTMQFSFGKQRVRFVGTSQTGWWSGMLDGKAAMGYELNRGHAVYSTSDLQTTFEWWSRGKEHGTY